MGVPNIPLRIPSHAQKVCSLYKRALRCLESHTPDRPLMRYKAVLLRDRFERNRCEKDAVKATKYLLDGEKELFENAHHQPKVFAASAGEVLWNRYGVSPDSVLDYWHPLEKAQYPEYFARREQRKRQMEQWWEKTYGKPGQDEKSHH
ncbi:hypothetical protein LSTR_LSTR000474 [Laodelphax striatellus]|uniref:NADH dehydrogenase [ubiquinone] 1 beta subcomplex subunit 9 n=1 Tax=Laodelphax striatellus TaxID=195883 RepID=A0A482X2K1_LAOST|nr:hypothetical protein LSTR_LSTR000474 [Laodelphax striatellus]